MPTHQGRHHSLGWYSELYRGENEVSTNIQHYLLYDCVQWEQPIQLLAALTSLQQLSPLGCFLKIFYKEQQEKRLRHWHCYSYQNKGQTEMNHFSGRKLRWWHQIVGWLQWSSASVLSRGPLGHLGVSDLGSHCRTYYLFTLLFWLLWKRMLFLSEWVCYLTGKDSCYNRTDLLHAT